ESLFSFFYSSRRRHTRSKRDWSSDVCSSDLNLDDDRVVIGSAQPKHTGGLMLNTRYKVFDMSVMFNWSYGNNIYNADKIDFVAYEGSKRYQNISNDMR